MKKLIACVTIIITHSLFSQQNYEKGYFINKNRNKVECLIKNENWKNTPSNFKYKLSHDSKVKLNNLNNVIEFSIPNSFKFEKHLTKIDKSSDLDYRLSKVRVPEYEETEVFLKVLVEAETKLYSYSTTNLTKFFFSKGTEKIVPLVYKRYTPVTTDIKVNELYKFQLRKLLPCPELNSKKVNYTKKSLIEYFINYNKCGIKSTNVKEEETLDYSINEIKSFIEFKIKAGVNLFTNTIKDDTKLNPTIVGEFNKIGLKFGAELEYFLPFNNHNWSVLINPNYQSLREKVTLANDKEPLIGDFVYELDYQSIQTTFVFRKYFSLNRTSKIFIDLGVNFNFPFSSSYTILSNKTKALQEFTNIPSSGLFTAGVGYKFKDFYLEARYIPEQDLLGTFTNVEVNNSSIALMLAYTILNSK
ncbi:hypothetical protein BTO06_10815 [Tenacibaculum sp. SZ-18]|uniref:hypothetical protein n=1 Tax=Tenacibaculum sp. SZ-18 TaxID=754423 RepID=UPI000C2D134A|nr:hypothetical protein [Tenacibaculum sp. SZ-18]AUC15606.1 hypothetical protein BTO06_10815 [Tenacibaculum sp. SZ-18]